MHTVAACLTIRQAAFYFCLEHTWIKLGKLRVRNHLKKCRHDGDHGHTKKCYSKTVGTDKILKMINVTQQADSDTSDLRAKRGAFEKAMKDLVKQFNVYLKSGK